MMLEKILALRQFYFRIVEQDLRKRADRGERRAQFVGDGGDEIVLEPVELGQALVGDAQLRRSRLEFARLLLEPVAVDHELRRLVEDLAHLVEA